MASRRSGCATRRRAPSSSRTISLSRDSPTEAHVIGSFSCSRQHHLIFGASYCLPVIQRIVGTSAGTAEGRIGNLGDPPMSCQLGYVRPRAPLRSNTEVPRLTLPSCLALTWTLKQTTLSEIIAKYRDAISPTKRSHETGRLVLSAFLLHPICRRRLSELHAEDFAAYRDDRLRKVNPPQYLATHTTPRYLVVS